jgi:molybdate transport system substrate-binding protein
MKAQSISTPSIRQCMALLALLAGLALAGAAAAEPPAALVVDGASSLTDALQRIGDQFTAATHIPVKFSFAASSALARQIEAGAPADVFFSADPDWMDYLEQRHLIRNGSRRNLLGNRLALVAPADSKLVLRIEPHFALRAALGQERLATGDPDVVPVGRYARAALTSLGAWDEVADRLVRAENVRSALMFVARGEVPLGIVYETDARVDPKVRIVDLFPTTTHPPIVYPAAMTSTAAPNAERFMEFLRAPEARATFQKFGFTVLP